MVSRDLQEQPVDRLSPADPLRRAMLHAIPELRSLALQFCGRPEKADTLVQETLVRGLAQIESFEPGTNMKDWLAAILRNHFSRLPTV